MLLLIFLLTLYIHIGMGRRLRINFGFSLLIFLYHFLFMIIYYEYTKYVHADAIDYFIFSNTEEIDFSPGVSFVYSILVLFRLLVDLTYLESFLIFNVFGSLAILYLNKNLQLLGVEFKTRLLIVIIPGFSFWSVAIGKDGIALLSITLFLHGLILTAKSKMINLEIFISFVLMFFVRPHFALIMIFAYSSAIIWGRKFNIMKIIIVLIIVLNTYLLKDFILRFLGLTDVPLEMIFAQLQERSTYNAIGDGAIDIADKNIILKIIIYVFGPFIWQISSFTQLISSLESFVLLFILYKLYKTSCVKAIEYSAFLMTCAVIYSVVFLFLNASFLSNIGIAARQKFLVLPVLFLLVIQLGAFHKNKSKFKQSRNQRRSAKPDSIRTASVMTR